jgi:hypothetical protein
MTLQVVGAGIGRTGTHSLKLALEQVLGAPCYHMMEVFEKPDHVEVWQRAIHGSSPDWTVLFDGYAAAVDWPVAAFYQELMELYPESIVLLSRREDAAAWWKSASSTIFQGIDRVALDAPAMARMILDLFNVRFTPDWRIEEASMAAYERHNASVRAAVPADRLVEWQPGDGWGPLCKGLGLPEPASPFPHVNTTAEFRAMTGLA